MVIQKWTQLRNRLFWKDPLNIQEGLEANATAEKMFLKRPPQFFFGSIVIQKWTQLRNRHFWKDPKNIKG